MRKIAIVTTYTNYDNYDVLVDSITDWSEVSDYDYQILVAESHNTGNFQVIERLDAKPDFIPKTIADYLQKAKEEAENKLRAEQAAKAKKEAAALKKKAKTEADELALLRQLQEKHKDKVNLPTQI